MSVEFLTPEEIAARFKVSKQDVYKWVQRGQIRHLRIGRSVRITREALDEFIAQSEEKGKAAGRASAQAA